MTFASKQVRARLLRPSHSGAKLAAHRAALGRIAFWAGMVVTIGAVALMALDDDALEKWCDRCCYRLRNDIRPYRTLEEDLGALPGATEEVV